jgi:hypothetical protein
MASTQRLCGPGLLLERVGAFELRLHLDTVDGGLRYRSQQVWLRLAKLRIPLPRWIAPQITASERQGQHEHEVQVEVEARLPWLGRLISYAGRLTISEERP